jgi:hypothetical protein
MDVYYTSPLTPFRTAVGASFGTFTTFQDVSPLPRPIIFPGQLRPGVTLELEAEGEFGTTGTPTLQLGFYYGTAASLALAVSSVITTGSGAAAWPWHMKYRGTVVAQGATGSIVGTGVLDFGTSLTAWTGSPIPITQALRTVTIDTLTQKEVGVGAAFGTSNAANTVKVNGFTALLLN